MKDAGVVRSRATELHPQGSEPAVMLDNFDSIQGNLEEAGMYFRKALALSPEPSAYNNLGLVHYYRGPYDLALRNWQTLLKAAPDKPIYSVTVADALRQLNRQDEAEAQYNKAIEGFRRALKANRS